jgi:hypothetical protein
MKANMFCHFIVGKTAGEMVKDIHLTIFVHNVIQWWRQNSSRQKVFTDGSHKET